MVTKICVNEESKFNAMILDLNKDLITFDTETTGLNISKLDILGISLYDGGETSYYIPLGHYYGNQLDLKETFERLNLFFQSKKELIAHNIVFDTKVCNKYGLDLENFKWFDTLIASHLINEERLSKGLKYLAKTELNMVMKNLVDVSDIDKLKYADINDMTDYSCDDVIATYRLYEKYKEEIKEKNLEQLFYKIEMPFLKVVKHMEETGILIDLTKLKESKEKIIQNIKVCETKIANLLGSGVQVDLFGNNVLNVDIDSAKQLSHLLYNKLKMPVLDQTAGGQPSTDLSTLKLLKNEHKIIEPIIEYKKLRKLLTAFIEPIPEHMDFDMKIRTSFKDHGTKTGRLASSKPNLQQLPKEDIYDVRSFFIASPGMKMVAIDYSQEELRVAAHICEDKTMIESYKNNQDLHLTVANKVFDLGLDYEQLTLGTERYKEAVEKYYKVRSYSKFISFGLLYGAGASGLSKLTGKSNKEAKEILDNYFNQFNKIKEQIESTERMINNYGYVTNIFGRRRHFKKNKFGKYNKRAYRQGFNFLIQGGCSDILRLAMIKCYNFIKDNGNEVKILMTVHDEVVFEVPANKIDYYVKGFETIMERIVSLKVNLKVESGVGDNYSQAK